MAASAIRYYESLGLVEATRTGGGQRRYPAETVLRLKGVAVARAAGFSLSEVLLLHQPLESERPLSERWAELAKIKLQELDSLIARAEEMKRRLEIGIECRCPDLRECPCLQP